MLDWILNRFKKPEDQVLAVIKITGSGMKSTFCVPEDAVDAFVRLQVLMFEEGFDISCEGMQNCMTYSDAETLLRKIDQLDDDSGTPLIRTVGLMMRSKTEDNPVYQ